MEKVIVVVATVGQAALKVVGFLADAINGFVDIFQ